MHQQASPLSDLAAQLMHSVNELYFVAVLE